MGLSHPQAQRISRASFSRIHSSADCLFNGSLQKVVLHNTVVTRLFTGKANFEHESELIDAYSEVGIECLVIWESEVNGDADGVRVRLEEFLGRLDSPGFLNCSRKSR